MTQTINTLCTVDPRSSTMPNITSSPSDETVSLTTPVNLTCEAEGHPAPTYEWYRDGEIIPGEILSYLYIPEASPADRGYYTCKAINPEDTTESTPGLLAIPGNLHC